MKIKAILKLIVALLIIVPAAGGIFYYVSNVENIPFETVCEKGHEQYTDLCNNIGKRAFTTKKLVAVNDTDFGKIIGVAWRKRGSSINSPGQESRRSDSNSYYYIISSDKKGYYFLRIVTEIDPR